MHGERQVTMSRRDALLVLLSGGAALAAASSALSGGGRAPESGAPALVRPRLLPFSSAVGSLSAYEKQRLWQLAVVTGALWGMAELSESELRSFLELKTQRPPSYLAEYRNALEVFAATGRQQLTPEAVQAILRHAPGRRAAQHARQFVIAEFIALHLASGGFHQFGLTRYRGFIGEGYRVSPIQPGTPR